jgi:hypothetical protein
VDDQFISDVYVEFSSQSSLEALSRGKKDEKVMLALLDDNDRLLREHHQNSTKATRINDPPLLRRRTMDMLTGADLYVRTVEAV